MKKLIGVISVLGIMLFLVSGCTGQKKADLTTKEAETALNNGTDIEGKTVSITVDKLKPKSAFGYNIQTGEHLNFVSSENPKVEKNEKLIVKVTNVKSVMGSYIIDYEKK